MTVEVVGIQLDLRGRQQAARGLDDTDKQIEQLGDAAVTAESKLRKGLGAIGGVARTVASGAAVVLGAVTAAGTVAATSLVRTGVAYNNLEQTSRAAMTTLLGTREAANKMMDDVREFGRTSPFPRQAFIAGTQQLLGFGFAAESIIPTLKTINDATAALGGNGETIGRFTDIFASIKANGKLSGDEVSRLGALGVDAIGILVEASGKSQKAVRKAIAAGAIGADDAIAVLAGGMDKKFSGAADNVKNTWAGAVDRVKGAWRDLGGDLVAPFVDPQGGGYAVAWANKLADKLRVIQGQVPGIIEKLRTGMTAGAGGGDGSMVDAWERVGFYAGRAWKIVSGVDWAGLMDRIGAVFTNGGVQKFLGAIMGDGPGATSQLQEISKSLGALQPAFLALANEAPTLSDLLTITAGVLGFLADHVDLLVAAMPYLVAGFVLYRLALLTAIIAQKSMALAQLASTVGTFRNTAATNALAASNTRLAAEMALSRGATVATTTATNVSTASRIRNTIAVGASRLASIAARGAMLAWTGVQWALNAAMSANPIGLVVVAIGALIAGAVWAYKNVDWFRKSVDWLWDALKTAGVWIWDVYLKFTPLGQIITHHKEIIGGLKKGWAGFVDILKSGKEWLEKVALGMLKIPGVSKLVQFGVDLVGGPSKSGNPDAGPVEPRAGGGPVDAGKPYVVGEREPELFVPKTDGVILPRVPRQGGDTPATGTVRGGMGSGDLYVTLRVGERELGDVVVKDFRRRVARA